MAWCPYEMLVYRFLDELRGSASVTFAIQLLASLNFSAFTIGLDGAAASVRIRGLAVSEKGGKRPPSQKGPLTVPMVLALEDTILDAKCLPDAVVAGQTLFCI
eukprot:260731-Amphidinium_carterae.2